jgi:hypothetical protein
VPVIDDPANNLTALLSSTGSMVYASAANTPATLAIGVANAVLQNIGSIPTWRTTLAGLTLTQPTIGDFTNAPHAHSSAAAGGTVAHASLANAGSTSHASLDAHVAAGSGVHGVAGLVVGTTDVQSLTNKTVNTLGPAVSGSGAIVGQTSPTINSPTIASPSLSGTVTNGGTITGGTITGVISGPFTSDWFRNSVAGQGIINQITGRGGYFGAGGLVDYPNGYTYFHSNNLSVPSSAIVGISDAQILSNKTVSIPVLSNYFTATTGSFALPAPTAGRIYAVKSWGGASLSVTAASIIFGAGGTTSLLLNNGESVTLVADGSNWWVI